MDLREKKARERQRKAVKHKAAVTEPTSKKLDMPPPRMPVEQTPMPEGRLSKILKGWDKTFRNFWFYVAAFTLILNVSYTFRPQIMVQVSATFPNNPLATLFSISNLGLWTFSSLRMTCVVWKGSTQVGTFSNNGWLAGPESAIAGNPDINQLVQGQTATRDCGIDGQEFYIRDLNSDALRIDVDITYVWLWGWKESTNSRHFNTRRVGGVIVLVPDVEEYSSPLSNL